MNAAEHDRNHELLCAWILGEASAEEAREVEQALAASPELRAERERLEQTIHLVQDSLSGDAQLSEASMASLMSAAAEPSRGTGAETPIHSITSASAWYRHPGLQAAAAVTVMLGGVLGILSIEGAPSPTDDFTAHTKALADSRPAEFQSAKRDAFEKSSLSMLDAPADVSQKYEPASGEAPLLALEESVEALRAPEDLGEVEVNVPWSREIQNDALFLQRAKRATEDLKRDAAGKVAAGEPVGKPSSAVDLSVQVRPLEEGQTIDSLEVLLADAEEIATGRLVERENSQLRLAKVEDEQERSAGDRARVRGRKRIADGSVLTGSDEFFLGRGEKTAAADPEKLKKQAPGGAPTAKAERPASEGPTSPGPAGRSTPGSSSRSSRTYRGPGDSAPPATDSLSRRRSSPTRSLSSGNEASDPGAGGGQLGLESITSDIEVEIGVRYLSIEDELLLTLGDDLRADKNEFRGGRIDRLRLIDLDEDEARSSRKLTDEELRRLSVIYADRRFQDCRRRPQENPRDMYFRYWGDNPFELTAKDQLSTFSVDVDTASYTLARRYLKEGHLPTREQIRTEEFLNYFDPDVPAPTEGTFAIQTELAPSLFGGPADRWMLRVAVRGRDVSKEERAPLALTFVIDTSGSMRENNRLELVKHAIRLLVGQLDARDSIAMVAYSSESRLILPMTSATQGDVIESALYPLQPNGSTNAEAGLKMGYAVAETALDPGVHNRVIFLSDGVANVGQTDQNRINADVARYRDAGVYLNTIGVGMNNHNDVFLEQLADKGDGICDYVDTPEAAQRAIVERFTGALIPIASDVKIQVQFDPGQVASYRLLGYENRAVADADFRNDKVDAGEVGAGHQVVALYELELLVKEGAEEPLANVHLRWKAPKAAKQHPLEVDVTEVDEPVNFADAVDSFASASSGYRQSVLVAQFAECLRRSTHARQDSFARLEQEVSKLAVELGDDDFHEFVGMVRKTIIMGLPLEHLRVSELSMTIEEYKRFLYLRAQLEELEALQDESGLKKLRDTNDSLEQKIRDLIHKELESRHG